MNRTYSTTRIKAGKRQRVAVTYDARGVSTVRPIGPWETIPTDSMEDRFAALLRRIRGRR